ncbi:DUF305 domain-containing protein [Streptomyces sp. YC504]|uniref:DUF305 domain-containing protein n=1 Tax=Streptomyces mesophilus TaxID=1775132 RepID=A0A6G4XL61_9ACTN|nr:DUF305 domain-containing protein [Streptomyces mesophilus]NGO77570.1 DUF305 domain-containing protein [Streptomyces mesophilus]
MCAAAVALLVVGLLVVGCTAQPTTGNTPPGAATSRASAFNSTDTAWILLMIPMAERARQLTDLAPSRSADPAVATLAARTGSALRTDLRRLRDALKLSGVPDTRPHEGHDMPGMVGLDTLDEAAAAKGRPFDRILTDALHAHFTQSRLLCTGEQNQGQADQAKDLAAAIAKSTGEQLSRLNKLVQPESADPSPTRNEEPAGQRPFSAGSRIATHST